MNADALSDLILAGAGFTLAWRAWPRRPAFALGAGLVALAAAIGVLRYLGVEAALEPHRLASLVAACAGFPLLAAGLWHKGMAQRLPLALAVGALLALAGVLLVRGAGLALWAQVLPALAALALLAAALRRRHLLLTAGSLLLCLTFSFSALRLEIFAGINGIQQLHLLLAACLALLWAGQVRESMQDQ